MKKRLLAALLTSALALSLTACGGGTDSSAADGGDTASTHDKSEAKPVLGRQT